MSNSSETTKSRSTQRTAMVHAGGGCELRCTLCDCTAPPSSPADLDRAILGGGARLVVRGACESGEAVATIVARARQEGFADIVLRTNAVACREPSRAAAFSRLGADAVLVPIFSQDPSVHDRITGRPRSLLDALSGMRKLARAGLAVEIEVPILSSALQNLAEIVRLVRSAVPILRAVRFYVPRSASPALTTASWDVAGPALASALLLCREHGIKVGLSTEDAIPLCALHSYPDLYDVYRFNPKMQASSRPHAVFGKACTACAVRDQCAGLSQAYRTLHGERGITAYGRRPTLMYEQRTTRRREWTDEQKASASKTRMLVLRPTVNCNQDCTFCSANETSANVWANHDDMLRAIARAARRGIGWLSFSGGEPTLSRHLVEYIHAASRLKIPTIEIISNAVLLDKSEKVDALVAAGLTHAFISLHAHDEEISRHSTQKIGDFTRTVRGIKNLVAAGVRTVLNHVISARNYPYLPEYVDFVRREFGGAVRISFAFVTPQFKALDNIEVMPRLSEVMPYLKRALYRALEIGQPFGVGSRQGIPFCFLDEFRPWSDGITLTHSAIAEDSPQKQRSPVCDECRYSNHCTGLWRPYVAKYGLDELHPVSGARLSDSEIESLKLAEMQYPWGFPLSFDEVSPLVREPDLEIGPPAVVAPMMASAEESFVPQRSRPLRLLMVGTGKQARRLAHGVRNVAGLTLDAIASPHALQLASTDFGDCPAYADAAAAIDDIRPEAVIVAAATPVHDELARLAISRGIPVLLEKPVTSSEEQANALRDLVVAAGATVMPAHNTLFASGLDQVLDRSLDPVLTSYVWRRTRASGDSMRTWNRSSFYETVHHLLAIVGRSVAGGEGRVVQVSFRGDSAPEYVRFELAYPNGVAEIVLDCTAALEEDVLLRRRRDDPESELMWRRQGRRIVAGPAASPREVESQGSDVERMLGCFREVVLGRISLPTNLDDAIDVMRTARAVVEALALAGAPFDRITAPRHVASRELRDQRSI